MGKTSRVFIPRSHLLPFYEVPLADVVAIDYATALGCNAAQVSTVTVWINMRQRPRTARTRTQLIKTKTKGQVNFGEASSCSRVTNLRSKTGQNYGSCSCEKQSTRLATTASCRWQCAINKELV